MTSSLSKQIAPIILLPLFYLLNLFNNYFPLVQVINILGGFIFFSLIGIFIFLFLLVIQKKSKAVLTSFVLLFYILFYGAFYDLFSSHIPGLAKHSVLSGLFALIFCLFFLLTRSFSTLQTERFIKVLTIILAALLFFETARSLILQITGNPKNEISKNIKTQPNQKPDVYLLIMDEYTSSETIASYYHGDNSEMDSFLLRSGFYQFTKSKSNYKRTPFSVASILNLDYTNGVSKVKNSESEELIRSYKKIKFNLLFNLYEQHGYRTVNYSNFDINKNVSPTLQTARLFNDRLLTANTLFGRLTTDLGWQIKSPLLKNLLGTGVTWQTFRDYNERTLKIINEEATFKSDKPKFVYTHLFMPHAPFLYNASGIPNNEKKFSIQNQHTPDQIPMYLQYVQYTNKKIQEIVRNIKYHTNNKAIIVIMGDHGYRVTDHRLPADHLFANFQAVFFPDRQYQLFYSTATPVNVMRLVTNKALHTNYPLLKDSCITSL